MALVRYIIAHPGQGGGILVSFFHECSILSEVQRNQLDIYKSLYVEETMQKNQ